VFKKGTLGDLRDQVAALWSQKRNTLTKTTQPTYGIFSLGCTLVVRIGKQYVNKSK